MVLTLRRRADGLADQAPSSRPPRKRSSAIRERRRSMPSAMMHENYRRPIRRLRRALPTPRRGQWATPPRRWSATPAMTRSTPSGRARRRARGNKVDRSRPVISTASPCPDDELATASTPSSSTHRAPAPAPQVKAIARRSMVSKRITMVSCNPSHLRPRRPHPRSTPATDLAWVQPIDAFLYAAEIELVAAFERANPP